MPIDKVLYIEIITICISVLGVLLYSDISHGRGPVLLGQKVFRYLLLINIMAMLFDTVSVIFDGTNMQYSGMIVKVSICLYYAAHSLASYFLLLYVDFELYPDKRRFLKRLPFYSIIVGINFFLSIISLWTGWFFVIDQNNSYQRGPVWYIFTALSLLYALWAIGIALQWAKKTGMQTRLGREQLGRMGLLPLIPCAGAILQGIMPGSSWAFSSTTLALVINYVTVQNRQMSRDHLTGLYNRGYLENFLNIQFRNLGKGKTAFLILLDIDRFKNINDTYGHLVGDDALIETANLLRNNCKRKEDFVVRLGGDEFVIIGQCEQVSTVHMIVERMEKVTRQFNERGTKPYTLSFSVGYALGEAGTDATLDRLINEADQKMYENKRAKNLQRR